MFKCFKDRERVREKEREVFLLSKVYYTFFLLAVSSRRNKLWYDEPLDLKEKTNIKIQSGSIEGGTGI